MGELQHGRDAEPAGGAATEEPVGGVAVGDWKDSQIVRPEGWPGWPSARTEGAHCSLARVV